MVARATLFLPNELIAEILSLLPVKPLMRFKCVNKFFKTLISNSHFIQKHLKNSTQNPNLALMWRHKKKSRHSLSLITFPISRLLQNKYTHLHFSKDNFSEKEEGTTLQTNAYYQLKDGDDHHQKLCLVGSCNGLLCFINIQYANSPGQKINGSIYFWNPATRTVSDRIILDCYLDDLHYCLGYDSLSDTYKLVAFRVVQVQRGKVTITTSVVKIFSLGSQYPRCIQSFPVIPLYWFNSDKNNGVHLNGTISWLAIQDYFCDNYHLGNICSITIDQYVIVSLDLSTESYTKLLLPQGFTEVPSVQPTLVVLMDHLCFCHDYEGIHFIIWKMKDFRVQESWIKLFEFSYQNIYPRRKRSGLGLFPLYLSENGDIWIFANDENYKAFIYNCRENKVEKIRITNRIWWLWAKDYVESLVLTQ